MRPLPVLAGAAFFGAFLSIVWAQTGSAPDMPDPATTPGTLNFAVTQDNIATTICRPGWTATVRPPLDYTERVKHQLFAASHLPGTIRDYELDHLVPLELGGAPSDPRNLWLEKWDGQWGAHTKDRLENALHRAVCAGAITLGQAQTAIVFDWKATYTLLVR